MKLIARIINNYYEAITGVYMGHIFGTSKPSQNEEQTNIKKSIDEIVKQGEDALKDVVLQNNIDDNLNILRTIFSNCYDLIIREFKLNDGDIRCSVSYIDGTVNKEEINENIIRPLIEVNIHDKSVNQYKPKELMEIIKKLSIPISTIKETNKVPIMVDEILTGSCILFVDGFDSVLTLGVKEWKMRETNDAKIESILRGPSEGYVENININSALIRRKLKTPDLKFEKLKVGRLSKTNVIIVYIKGLVEESLVNEVLKRIGQVDVDLIIESGNLEQLIEDTHYSPFSQMEFTERPDRSVFALAEGRIIILIDNTPFALIVPTVFAHFMKSVEDNYERTYYAVFIIIVRYLAFFVALLVPALYIAITSFHQEMIPYPLFITIASTRANVPFPVFLEATLMEGTFELLREAGERLPRAIGQSLSIVGALVIGQAAIQAGLVSPSMVVVLAVTATASFTTPTLSMSRSVRLLRFPMMFLGGAFGIYGIIMGLLALMIHMTSLRSMGVPYLSPYAPMKMADWKTAVFRMPFWASAKRPSFIQKNNISRAKKVH
jgi:spore germination protein KA